jgi:hypothetical protein
MHLIARELCYCRWFRIGASRDATSNMLVRSIAAGNDVLGFVVNSKSQEYSWLKKAEKSAVKYAFRARPKKLAW